MNGKQYELQLLEAIGQAYKAIVLLRSVTAETERLLDEIDRDPEVPDRIKQRIREMRREMDRLVASNQE